MIARNDSLPPDDDDAKQWALEQMKLLLPIVSSPAMAVKTRGKNDKIDPIVLNPEYQPDDEPIDRAIGAELAVMNLLLLGEKTPDGEALDTLKGWIKQAVGRLADSYHRAGVPDAEKTAQDFMQSVSRKGSQLLHPQGIHDVAATIPLTPPDKAEVAARQETAKLLEEMTGLNVEIVPRDDYRRQWYQFTAKPKDPKQKLTDEPFVVHALHTCVHDVFRDAGSAGGSMMLQMSPKDDWYSSVKLHFSTGSGLSLPAKDALEEARAMKKGLMDHLRQQGIRSLEEYHQKKMTDLPFVDGNSKKLGE